MIYVCIPSRNEATTLGPLLWKVQKVLRGFGREFRIVVLDDASDDETAEVLERYEGKLPLEILRNAGPEGYGASVDRLLRHVAEVAAYPKRDAAVVLQADLTEDPAEIVELVKTLEGGADVVAGAAASTEFVLTSGVAGLLAGALSMAAGEYVSVRSQREMFEYQIGLERDELREYPEEEAEELALIYETRGVDLDEARRITRELVKNESAALDALAREELGLDPDDLGSPWGAAMFSFVAFAAGAALPLMPFVFGWGGGRTVLVAAGLAGIALFLVGAALSLFTGRDALRGGLRMVLIGGGAGAVTWLIGRMLGAAIV